MFNSQAFDKQAVIPSKKPSTEPDFVPRAINVTYVNPTYGKVIFSAEDSHVNMDVMFWTSVHPTIYKGTSKDVVNIVEAITKHYQVVEVETNCKQWKNNGKR